MEPAEQARLAAAARVALAGRSLLLVADDRDQVTACAVYAEEGRAGGISLITILYPRRQAMRGRGNGKSPAR